MVFHPRSALFRSGGQAAPKDDSTSKSNGDSIGQDRGRMVTFTRLFSLPGPVCPSHSMSVISLQHYMNGMLFVSTKEQAQRESKSLASISVTLGRLSAPCRPLWP